MHAPCGMLPAPGGTEEGGIPRVLFGCAGRYRGMVRRAHSFVWGATCCICSLDGPAGQKGVRVDLRVSLQADTVQNVSSRRCSSGPETWTDGSRQHVENFNECSWRFNVCATAKAIAAPLDELLQTTADRLVDPRKRQETLSAKGNHASG